jgi:hypothetical protein
MRAARAFILGGLVAGVAACDRLDSFGDGVTPAPRPPLVVDEETPESRELRAYYARVEQGHRTRGLLRTDGGGPDVPYDAEKLARTFNAVAFAREFSDVGPALIRVESASILHRWEGPVRMEPIFGASVPDTQRADDTAAIRRYAERLARVTGHPIEFTDRGGNFRVLVLSEEERRVSGPLLRRLIPGLRKQEIDIIQNLDRESYCVVVAADAKDDGVLTQAVAVIRAELPPLLRLSCVHEELAQGLGLSNDSPQARPSIFNDDDEFGRLTAMDEDMLGMLYDPRLSPGMDAATAAPIVRMLAEARRGAGS